MNAIAAERQLGLVEGVRVVRNPVLWLAVATLVMYTTSVDEPAGEHFLLTGYGLVLPAFVAMVLTAMGVRRSHTQGADALFDVLPVGPARRTVGHGVSAVVVGLLALVLTIGVWLYRWPSTVLGVAEETIPSGIDVPRPTIAQALQGPMALVAFCALGIALGRWIPTWLIAVVLFVPVALQFLWFGTWLGENLRPSTWWWPLSAGWVHGEWIGPCDASGRCGLQVAGFDRATPWWHLAYLAALAVLLVTVAVLRHRRDRTAWVAFGLSGVTLVALAAAQSVVYERFEPLVGA